MCEKMKTHIEVEGVILTPEVIARLKSFQDNNNDTIQSIRETIADAVCFIGQNLDTVHSDDFTKIQYLITDLSFIRNYFDELRKP